MAHSIQLQDPCLLRPAPSLITENELKTLAGTVKSALITHALLSSECFQGDTRDYSAYARTLSDVILQNGAIYHSSTYTAAMQLLGFSTAGNLIIGSVYLHQALQVLDQAVELKNAQKVFLATLDCATAAVLTGVGLSYGIARTANIANALTAGSSPFWSALATSPFGATSIGTYLCVPLYILCAIVEWFKHPYHSPLGQKLSALIHGESTEAEIIQELKQELTEAPNTPENTYLAIAHQHLTKQIKNNLEVLKQQNIVTISDPKQEETSIKDLIAKTDQVALKAFGKSKFIEETKALKFQELEQTLGVDEAKNLIQALNQPDPSFEKIKNIYNGAIRKHSFFSRYEFWSSRKKCILYTIGVIAMALLSLSCLTTVPIWATIGSLVYVCVAFCEMTISLKGLYAIEQKTTEPGEYDRAIPKISMAFAVLAIVISVTYILLTVGLSALAFPVLITVIPAFVVMIFWLAINYRLLKAIDKREQNYAQAIQDKFTLNKTLSPQEYCDLYTYLNKTDWDKHSKDYNQHVSSEFKVFYEKHSMFLINSSKSEKKRSQNYIINLFEIEKLKKSEIAKLYKKEFGSKEQISLPKIKRSNSTTSI